MKKIALIILIAVTLITASAPAFGYDQDLEVTLDILITRPVSLVATVVYLGPGSVIMFCGWLLYLVMYLGGINLLQTAPRTGSGIAALLIAGALGVLFLSLFAGLCLLLVGGLPLPAALGHLAAREKLGAAFHIFELGSVLSANRWGYFLGWVVVVGLTTLIQFAAMLLFFTLILSAVAYILILPLSFYLLLVAAAVFAQAYREGAARSAAAAPAAQPAPAPAEPAEPLPAQPGTPEGAEPSRGENI